MKVRDILNHSSFQLVTGNRLEDDVGGMYTGDLLSWVMSHAKEHDAWITVQTHLNILAIAVLLNLSCIIIADGAKLEEETIQKAKEENITLIHTSLNAVEVIRCLYD